jgi:hypothetical protein
MRRLPAFRSRHAIAMMTAIEARAVPCGVEFRQGTHLSGLMILPRSRNGTLAKSTSWYPTDVQTGASPGFPVTYF